ncbi:hypothetical protein Vadar_019532 [Vaccinium darrowii]|uniref:Uncharacterized protein n=1 Tax=Vaccinium darrowii TaxID=229202 RepID=A0ACB7X227_9ERIC|nr:hypothetical protein Vadar_019532 [Vaccinium darrowii]
MEITSGLQERENPSPTTSPTSNLTTTTTTSNSNNNGLLFHSQTQTTSPLPPEPSSRSKPNTKKNPRTTFVHADATTFRQTVQTLTGYRDTANQASKHPTCPDPPQSGNLIPPIKKQGFKRRKKHNRNYMLDMDRKRLAEAELVKEKEPRKEEDFHSAIEMGKKTGLKLDLHETAGKQKVLKTVLGLSPSGTRLKIESAPPVEGGLATRKVTYWAGEGRKTSTTYSDATFSIPDLGSNSGTAPEGGVLYMEESVWLNEMGEVATQGQKLSPEVSYSSEEELLEEMWLDELDGPSDPGELEDLNFDPMEVPPTISHHFSILHVLDLSYTEINSLLQSISRLVALQKLFLRSCDLLHELPPEIGRTLESTVIPRRVLSNLSRLNELIIHVTPYGEWWDVEVEAIIDDLCSLDELRTLKLYLPTAELLEGLTRIFSRLAIFKFTVGRHEEHFISRLRRDVEEEFNNQEKLEKGLKYINGSRIPNEITKVFKHANAFFLQRHWTVESLSEFGHENMNEVKFCLVMECNEFQTIIDFEQFYQGKDGRSESKDFMDIDENIVLGSLQKLIICYMKNMASIWNGPVGKGSLSNLKSLALHTCPNLATVFTIDMLSNLINLEELIVEDCPKIDSLVSLQSSNSKSGLFLPNLKKISLLELPELVSISSGLWIAPKLEKMVIFYCPKLKKLSTMDVSSTNLKVIKGEKEWWHALKWYESDLSTEHEDYLARLFIPLRRDGDLMAQLTKD